MIDCTVIIPVAADTPADVDALLLAVQSARDNGCPVIVVDDASKQAVAWAVGPDVTVLRNPDRMGPGQARNRALAACHTRFVIPLDADDELMFDGVNKLLVASGGESCMVYGDVLLNGDCWQQQRPNITAILHGWRVPVITALYPADTLRALGGWREDMIGLEDAELWVRLLRAGVEVRYTPEVIFSYNRRDDGRAAMMGSAAWQTLRAIHADVWERARKRRNQQAETAAILQEPIHLLYIGSGKRSFGVRGPVTGRKYRVEPEGGVMVEGADVDRLMRLYDVFEVSELPVFVLDDRRRDAVWRQLNTELESAYGPR